MHTTTEPPLPPPPPFAISCELDPSDEVDVDMEAEDDLGEEEQDQLASNTQQEEIEYMGEYPTLEAYARSMLEEFIAPCATWIFDALDWEAVLTKMEAGRYRYVLEGGAVYRAGLPQSKPSKDKDDSPGPWMPTRGG